MAVQIFSNLEGTAGVALHPEVKGLQSEAEVEGILRALDRAEIPHQLAGCLGDVGEFPELPGVGESMVGRVRSGESGELVRVGFPVEVAAVHDRTAH